MGHRGDSTAEGAGTQHQRTLPPHTQQKRSVLLSSFHPLGLCGHVLRLTTQQVLTHGSNVLIQARSPVALSLPFLWCKRPRCRSGDIKSSVKTMCTARLVLTIVTRLDLGRSAAGSLGTGRGLAPQGLLGYQLDGDAPADVGATQTPRAVASLKIIVCWGEKSTSGYQTFPRTGRRNN